ncbi:uncharacterized protein LOC142776947 [Rhipicephalus microplus]|uniref:uncharacterized protein LOC142776947 n=1 Tax=Rhipicephalus microplus TaxID=6941 RepID=UPI003F6BADA7
MQLRCSRWWGAWVALLLILLVFCVHESKQGKMLKLVGAAALLGGHRGFVPIPIPIHYGRNDDHHHHHHHHSYHPHYNYHHYPSHHYHHYGHGDDYGGHGGHGDYSGWW